LAYLRLWSFTAARCSMTLAFSTMICFLYDEDTDLSFRAQLAGWKCVFVPGAVVQHISNASRVERYRQPLRRTGPSRTARRVHEQSFSLRLKGPRKAR
jgi:hypothetical protein